MRVFSDGIKIKSVPGWAAAPVLLIALPVFLMIAGFGTLLLLASSVGSFPKKSQGFTGRRPGSNLSKGDVIDITGTVERLDNPPS